MKHLIVTSDRPARLDMLIPELCALQPGQVALDIIA
jgi:hypothetical protein